MKFEEVLSAARRVLIQAVQGPDYQGMGITLLVHRNDKVVAGVGIPEREMAPTVLHIASKGFAATGLTVTFEAVMVNEENDRGNYTYGDANRAFVRNDPNATTALVVSHTERIDNEAVGTTAICPYTAKGNFIMFSKAKQMIIKATDHDGRVEGDWVDWSAAALKEQALLSHLASLDMDNLPSEVSKDILEWAKEHLEEDRDAAQRGADRATVRILEENNIPAKLMY